MSVILQKISRDDESAMEEINDDFHNGTCMIVPGDEVGADELFDNDMILDAEHYNYVVFSYCNFVLKVSCK